MRNGQYDEALSCYTEAILYVHDNSILFANRALTFLKLEKYCSSPLLQLLTNSRYRYQDAILDCDRSIELDSKFVKSYGRRATAYMHLRKYDLALKGSFRHSNLIHI